MKLSYFKWKQNNQIAFAQKVYAENWEKIKILNDEINRRALEKAELIQESNKYHLCADTNRSLFNDVKYIDCNEFKPTYITPDLVIHEMTDEQMYYNWRVNKDWMSQKYLHLEWTTIVERSKNLLKQMNRDSSEFVLYNKAWIETWINTSVLICIAKSDSSLGNESKSRYNPWNVGNTDRWDIQHYESMEKWILAIWRTLNNQYLWNKKVIWELSPWWKMWKAPYYATSDSSWNVNLLNCLSMIYNKPINESFEFRN